MTDEELEEIVNSERASYTLMEPDYSKVKFTIHCMMNEMAKRGMARFWPIIKKGDEIMTYEEEQELQGDEVVELLNEISKASFTAFTARDFVMARTLDRWSETIKNLHISNTEAIQENRSMSDHHRTHFAGLAMQSLLTISREECSINTVRKAFDIADNMVKYGKQDSKTKGSGAGLGTTSAEGNN